MYLCVCSCRSLSKLMLLTVIPVPVSVGGMESISGVQALKQPSLISWVEQIMDHFWLWLLGMSIMGRLKNVLTFILSYFIFNFRDKEDNGA